MKRILFAIPVIGAIFFSGFLMAADKTKPANIGYLDSDEVIQAHPNYSKVTAVQNSATKDLQPVTDKLKVLDPKIKEGTASAKEQADYKSLSKTYSDLRTKWATKTQAALDPITSEINGTITKYARQNGYAVILDYKIAAQSGLIVYGDPEINLTEEITKLVTN